MTCKTFRQDPGKPEAARARTGSRPQLSRVTDDSFPARPNIFRSSRWLQEIAVITDDIFRIGGNRKRTKWAKKEENGEQVGRHKEKKVKNEV